MSALIANITNDYGELIRVMETQYGNIDILIPLLIEEIRDLIPPSERYEESQNITTILKVFSFFMKMEKKESLMNQ